MERKFKNGMGPVHPGEILREEFLVPLNSTVDQLMTPHLNADNCLNLTLSILEGVAQEKIDVSEPIAEVLANGTGTSKEFWMNLQNSYEEQKRNAV